MGWKVEVKPKPKKRSLIMAGCGKKIAVSVPTRYSAKIITTKCGATSPWGDPWLCEKCERIHAGRDWRREAELAGEQWDEDY